jgi:hypothetical protein
MNSPVVHRALVTEVPALAGTLQAAFDGYAWTDWVFPADNRAAQSAGTPGPWSCTRGPAPQCLHGSASGGSRSCCPTIRRSPTHRAGRRPAWRRTPLPRPAAHCVREGTGPAVHRTSATARTPTASSPACPRSVPARQRATSNAQPAHQVPSIGPRPIIIPQHHRQRAGVSKPANRARRPGRLDLVTRSLPAPRHPRHLPRPGRAPGHRLRRGNRRRALLDAPTRTSPPNRPFAGTTADQQQDGDDPHVVDQPSATSN